MSTRRLRPENDPFHTGGFVLSVAKSGYRWVRRAFVEVEFTPAGRTAPEKGVGLVMLPAPDEFPRPACEPLAIPDLFRRFAETQTDTESVLAFANLYGEVGAF